MIPSWAAPGRITHRRANRCYPRWNPRNKNWLPEDRACFTQLLCRGAPPATSEKCRTGTADRNGTADIAGNTGSAGGIAVAKSAGTRRRTGGTTRIGDDRRDGARCAASMVSSPRACRVSSRFRSRVSLPQVRWMAPLRQAVSRVRPAPDRWTRELRVRLRQDARPTAVRWPRDRRTVWT